MSIYDNPKARERLQAITEVLAGGDSESDVSLSAYADLLKADLYRWEGEYDPAAVLYRRVLEASESLPGERGAGAFTVLAEIASATARGVPSDNEPTPRPVPSADQMICDAFLGLGRVEVKHFRWESAEQFLLAAKDRAVNSGDSMLEVRARRSLGWAYLDQGRISDAESELRVCIAAIEGSRPETASLRSRILGDLGRAAYLRGEIAESCRITEEAIGFSEAAGDIPSKAILLNNVARAYHFMGRWQEALDSWQESRKLSLSVADPYNAGFAVSNLAKVRYDIGDYDDSIADADNFISFCRSIGYGYGESIGLLTRSGALSMKGDEAAARGSLLAALRIQRSIGVTYGLPYGLLAAGKFHLSFGRAARAENAFMASARRFAAIGDRYNQATALHLLAEAQWSADSTSDAMRTATRLLPELEEDSFRLIAVRVHCLLAVIARQLGRDEEFARHQQTCLALSRDMDPRVSEQAVTRMTGD